VTNRLRGRGEEIAYRMQQTHEYMSVAVKYNPSLTPNETSLRNPEVAPVESDPRRGQARPPESSGNRGAVNTQASAICSSISEQTNTAGGKQKEGQKRTHQEPTASPRSRSSRSRSPPPRAWDWDGARSRSPMGPRSRWRCRVSEY
jgi:hypothetical protein